MSGERNEIGGMIKNADLEVIICNQDILSDNGFRDAGAGPDIFTVIRLGKVPPIRISSI